MKLSEYFDKQSGNRLLARALEYTFRFSANISNDPEVGYVEAGIPVIYIPEPPSGLFNAFKGHELLIPTHIKTTAIQTKSYRYMFANDTEERQYTILYAYHDPSERIYINIQEQVITKGAVGA